MYWTGYERKRPAVRMFTHICLKGMWDEEKETVKPSHYMPQRHEGVAEVAYSSTYSGHGGRNGWVVSDTPQPLYLRERDPVPIV
jgi:hypothetical protein